MEISKSKKFVESVVANAHTKPILLEDRLIEDHKIILEIVEKMRQMGLLIVYTMGTWDLFHVGHGRYIRKAKEFGDALFVGIDGDEYIKKHKGPDRPIVPYNERWETIVDHRSVDFATILNTQTANDELVQMIRPDVVVLSFSSTKDNFEEYKDRMQKKYGPYCGRVEILPRQAETSTSEKIRTIIVTGVKPLLELVKNHTSKLLEAVEDFFKKLERGGGS